MSDFFSLDPIILAAIVQATCFGLLCGWFGSFAKMRNDTFAVDTFAHVAFAGSLSGAALLGSPLVGISIFIVTAAFVISKGKAMTFNAGAMSALVLSGSVALGITIASLFSKSGSTVSKISGAAFGSTYNFVGFKVMSVVVFAFIIALLARRAIIASLINPISQKYNVNLINKIWFLALGTITGCSTMVFGSFAVIGLLSIPPAIAARITNKLSVHAFLSLITGGAMALFGMLATSWTEGISPTFAMISTGLLVLGLVVSFQRLKHLIL